MIEAVDKALEEERAARQFARTAAQMTTCPERIENAPPGSGAGQVPYFHQERRLGGEPLVMNGRNIKRHSCDDLRGASVHE